VVADGHHPHAHAVQEVAVGQAAVLVEVKGALEHVTSVQKEHVALRGTEAVEKRDHPGKAA
jgi:citrate lyase gamma subunit